MQVISRNSIDALVRANDSAELFFRDGAVAQVRPDEKGCHIIDNVNGSMLTGSPPSETLGAYEIPPCSAGGVHDREPERFGFPQ